jgi:hypothetical protein
VAFAVAVGLGAAGGCELVLGDLPPVRASADGGGASGTSSTSTSSTSTTGTSTSTSGSTASSAGGTGGACCDCDDDGYRSEALCAANDCDDHDPLVHPGQMMYFDTPSKNVGFDYDCSGAPEPQYPNAIKCSLLNGDCDAGVGFLNTVPPCGVAGQWGSCVAGSLPLTCQDQVIESAMISACH